MVRANRLVAVALVVAAVWPLVPAHAQPTTPPPVIKNPSEGAIVGSGFSGPVSIDFTDAARLEFQIAVGCDGGYSWSTTYQPGTDGPDLMSWTIPPISEPDSCAVTAYAGATYGWDSNDFAVVVPTTKVREGSRWFRSGHSRSCDVSNRPARQDVLLTCNGGLYAWVKYRFAVPADASEIRWRVIGHRGCCAVGRVTKAGWLALADSYMVRVKVTKRSSFRVNSVLLSYVTGQTG